MAQVVYYFFSALCLGAPYRKISFSVPTGNFGNIFSGYIAKKMGLPIDQLVIANNQNDILHRVIEKNDMSRQSLNVTLSPSMDVMVPSNFERLLFDAYSHDGVAIDDFMARFSKGNISLNSKAWSYVTEHFDSHTVNDEKTCQVIRKVFDETKYLLDPHTAVGLEAARKCWKNKSVPIITLATAHPLKFPKVLEKVDCQWPGLPRGMEDLFALEESYSILENNITCIQQFVYDHI